MTEAAVEVKRRPQLSDVRAANGEGFWLRRGKGGAFVLEDSRGAVVWLDEEDMMTGLSRRAAERLKILYPEIKERS